MEENFLGNLVIQRLQKIIGDAALVQKMGESARGFYKADAARVIAEGILGIII